MSIAIDVPIKQTAFRSVRPVLLDRKVIAFLTMENGWGKAWWLVPGGLPVGTHGVHYKGLVVRGSSGTYVDNDNRNEEVEKIIARDRLKEPAEREYKTLEELQGEATVAKAKAWSHWEHTLLNATEKRREASVRITALQTTRSRMDRVSPAATPAEIEALVWAVGVAEKEMNDWHETVAKVKAELAKLNTNNPVDAG